MTVDRLREALLRHRAGRAVYLLVHNLDAHHAVLAASAMAFDAFLSLVPLTAAAGYVLHYLHESGEVVLGPLIRAAPGPVAQLVDDAFLRLPASGVAVVAPVSALAFLWTSSAGLSTAMSVFEAVFHSPPRPFWMRRLIAIGCVIGGLGAIAVLTGIAIELRGLLGSGLGIGRYVAFSVPTITVVVLMSAFFRIAIRGPRPLRRRVLPGVLVTVALWSITTALFSLYVAKLARYATLYGGLAAVAIFLFWLWLLALAMLVGGEVNAQLEGVRVDPPELSARGDGKAASVRPPPSAAAAGAPRSR